MDKEKLEVIYQSGMWYLFLVSLISSDTLVDIESCEQSLFTINSTLTALPEANIPEEEKTKAVEMLQKGIKIVERDMKMFQQNKKNSN